MVPRQQKLPALENQVLGNVLVRKARQLARL